MTKKTDASVSSPKPTVEHARLAAFVGKWKIRGHQLEGPIGPAAEITATETFEWLSGRFFLIHRFDGRVGDGLAACVEIVGYDAASQSYPVHTFYNNGVQNEWRYRPDGNTWTLTGEWPMPDGPAPVRCTVAFSDGGRTMTGTWEIRRGEGWITFWDVRSTKLE